VIWVNGGLQHRVLRRDIQIRANASQIWANALGKETILGERLQKIGARSYSWRQHECDCRYREQRVAIAVKQGKACETCTAALKEPSTGATAAGTWISLLHSDEAATQPHSLLYLRSPPQHTPNTHMHFPPSPAHTRCQPHTQVDQDSIMRGPNTTVTVYAFCPGPVSVINHSSSSLLLLLTVCTTYSRAASLHPQHNIQEANIGRQD